jgi:hypothetical protein
MQNRECLDEHACGTNAVRPSLEKECPTPVQSPQEIGEMFSDAGLSKVEKTEICYSVGAAVFPECAEIKKTMESKNYFIIGGLGLFFLFAFAEIMLIHHKSH